ncbi:MAG: carbohydrate kinase family protein [Phycisphaeraceae bacterium]|nr:carbohydrate kinase family protein [Phycisphaeraceae bacterium]
MSTPNPSNPSPTPPPDRATIARRAADALEANAARLASAHALVGFDGFIDDIHDAVRTRRSMAPDDYDRIATITEFADRCRAAAGRSTNIELVRRESRPGGNGPLLANGIAALTLPTTFIGCVGSPDDPGTLHPIYAPLAARCRRVVPIAPPGHTDALEFDDGKIMLNQTARVQAATWDAVSAGVGAEPLRAMLAEATLIGIVNWSLCGGIESIWSALIDGVLPTLPPPPSGLRRRVFIDLSDPAKRSDADIGRALSLLASMNRIVPVTLGLNLAEGERIAGVLDASWRSLPELAASIRQAAELDTVVVHPREGASAASVDRHANPLPAGWFDGPVARAPRLSTGAGDAFNAGFAVAQTLDLPLDECLAVGVAASGAYVRGAANPSLPRLVAFLRDLPAPEPGGITPPLA